ncbi:MAG: hypothetical protein HOV87_28560 [Catenulispora sp.]|nr:hypothetical protein [Catenulispora sp.]
MAGLGISVDDLDTAKTIVGDDLAVQAGILSCTIHPCRSFPGPALATGGLLTWVYVRATP